MLWKLSIIPEILVMGQQNAAVPPRTCEHGAVIVAVEFDLPNVNCIQAVVLEEFNGTRA